MVCLEGQVLVLLEGEQHRSYQGDLGGAENKGKKVCDHVCVCVCVWGGVRSTAQKTGMHADANAGPTH